MTRPVLCWVGGKTKLKKKIISRIPNHDQYIEPFVGGGSVFFDKPPSKHEVINDKNKSLIKFYKDFKNAKRLNCGCGVPSKKHFETAKKKIEQNKASMCDYLLVNKISYGCGGENISENKKDKWVKTGCKCMNKDFLQLKNRMKNVKIENKDFRDVIKKHDGKKSFFYIDPPYEGTACPSSYTCENLKAKDVKKAVDGIKGKFLLSYKDTPETRKLFCKKYKCERVKTKYELQRAIIGKPKNKSELLISNY